MLNYAIPILRVNHEPFCVFLIHNVVMTKNTTMLGLYSSEIGLKKLTTENKYISLNEKLNTFVFRFIERLFRFIIEIMKRLEF